MAKAYAFRIVIRPAEFYPGGVSVAYSITGRGQGPYLDRVATATLDEAISLRSAASAAESRPHAAFLEMAQRADRCPPGFKAKAPTLYRQA